MSEKVEVSFMPDGDPVWGEYGLHFYEFSPEEAKLYRDLEVCPALFGSPTFASVSDHDNRGIPTHNPNDYVIRKPTRWSKLLRWFKMR